MSKYILAGVCIFSAVSVYAVVVSGGDGQNTNAPTGGQGWDYVGRIDHVTANSSVTYISNNWFVTGYHVQVLDAPTGILFGGSSYSINAGSWTRLTNSVGGDADLAMFRVTGSIGLSALSVGTSPLANGSALTMIGNGRNREAGQTYWDAGWNEVPSGGHTYSGYKWAAGSDKRWGLNSKEADAGLVDDGFGITDMFYTDFDPPDDEAQGATFDSGGGVFVDNGGNWELAGLMLTTSAYAGQPAETAVYGNRTYAADMQYYAEQINTTAAIPEPSALVLAVLAPTAAFFIRRTFML